MTNPDEIYICALANQIDGISARLATPEEDYGYQKADVIVSNSSENLYYLQVSHTHKSKREIAKLLKRGTHPISTHKYANMPFSDNELITQIHKILENN